MNLLFLCVANSARSQLAEGLGRSMAAPGVSVRSAGSAPSRVRPEAIAVLAEVGIDASSHRSTSASDVDPASVDVVITLCADEVCPVMLGAARQLHWPFPDPAGHDEDAEARLARFRSTRDAIAVRLRAWLGEEGLLRVDPPPRDGGAGGAEP